MTFLRAKSSSRPCRRMAVARPRYYENARRCRRSDRERHPNARRRWSKFCSFGQELFADVPIILVSGTAQPPDAREFEFLRSHSRLLNSCK